MGWQARLSKEDKSCFEPTCNKCNGTGVKKTYVSMAGRVFNEPIQVPCKCAIPKELPPEAPPVLDPS